MIRTFSTVSLLAVCAASSSADSIIDFNGLAAGTFLTNQIDGVTFSADNATPGRPDRAIVWDFDGNPELAFAGQQAPFTIGNAAGRTLGNGVALASGGVSTGPNGSLTTPLEKNRPAGVITLTFDNPLVSFGLTVVDVEGPEEFSEGFFFDFIADGVEVGKVTYEDLITPGSGFYDASIVFGNNSANQIQPIEASTFGVASFDTVAIGMGGSEVLAQVTATSVPTPSAFLAGLGLMGLAGLKRRRHADVA